MLRRWIIRIGVWCQLGLKGVYILALEVEREIRVRVGALGALEFKPGRYVYLGSAQSGVEARISRHFRGEKRVRWHIDYLLSSGSVRLLWAAAFPLPRNYECRLAAMASELGGKPVKGFGSTDCRCSSHLYLFPRLKSLLRRAEELLGLKAALIAGSRGDMGGRRGRPSPRRGTSPRRPPRRRGGMRPDNRGRLGG